MNKTKNKKLVVLGDKSLLVEVIGDNPHIKGSVYVRYQDGGTDSFKPRFLIDIPDCYDRLEQENEAFKNAITWHVEHTEELHQEVAELRELATMVVNLSKVSDVPISISSKAKELLNK